jgi:hypothetical protein
MPIDGNQCIFDFLGIAAAALLRRNVMRATYHLLAVLGLTLSGCGNDAGKSAALIHDPPIKELKSDQLRVLAMTCETYPVNKSARGPYDAAYCKSAIDAWNNVPLQVAPIPPPVLNGRPN